MSKWCWLFFLFFVHAEAFCNTVSTDDTTEVKYDVATIAAIDQINKDAHDTFLANPANARKLAEEALIKAKTINYRKGVGQSFFNIGASYWAQSYCQISLLYIDTAVQYFSPADRYELSTCYRFMARDHIDLKDYDNARDLFIKAADEAGTDPYLLEQVTGERALLYLGLKRFDLAINEANRALKIVKKTNDKAEEAILYGRLSSIYSQYNDATHNDMAIRYTDTAVSLSYLPNNKRLRAGSWVTRANVLLNQNKQDEALQYANSGLLLADSLGLAEITANAYKAIIRIYQTKGDTKQLLAYEAGYNTFQENLEKTIQQNSSQLIIDHFALSDKLRKIDQVSRNGNTVRSQKRIIIILSVVLILLAIALYIVYRYYREKRTLALNLNDRHLATIAQSQLIEVQAQHLEELNNLKNKLLLVIGHDLRGPIGNLSSLTGMFEHGHLKDEEIRQVMRSIGPVVRGAELTLKNLLEWAENQIKGTNLQAACIVLFPIVDEIENIFKYSFDEKNITFVNQATPEHTVFIDPNHLKVILRNLISNAIKFTPSKGQVSVTSHYIKDKITISVSDTGRGMSNEEIERLLSVKTHFTKPGTQGEKGTGIGLLLCRELIELNGGELWLTSEVEKGTTFYFSLPAC